MLPVDHVVCTNIEDRENIASVSANGFRADQIGVDIGPRTIEQYAHALKNAATIFFNGPMGISEVPEFCQGTEILAAVAQSDAFSVVGGGDSIAALNKFGLLHDIDFVSSGGGASLELIEGKRLPGLVALGYYLARV